jgi:hypothetical protein
MFITPSSDSEQNSTIGLRTGSAHDDSAFFGEKQGKRPTMRLIIKGAVSNFGEAVTSKSSRQF